MDLWKLRLLILLTCLCLLRAKVGSSGSVAFIDGNGSRYFRPHSDSDGELSHLNLLSLSETAATISVLLGIAPPVSLTVESSLKLDQVLLPNPFNRPRAVVMLDVKGIEGIPISNDVLNSRIINSDRAQIELSEDDEISLISITEQVDCGSACTDKEFYNLAHWFGGTYVGSTDTQDGKLEFPLASGRLLKLHVSKKAEQDFALTLVSLLNGVKMAMEMHHDFSASINKPVELLAGSFTGFKALAECGSSEVAEEAVELFQMILAKLFGLLQKSYGGEIVGIILFNKDLLVDSESILDLKLKSRISRLLKESTAVNTTTSEVALVRQSLAWITGIILLISFLIGIYYLLYMPFTKDTLLYSNVKID